MRLERDTKNLNRLKDDVVAEIAKITSIQKQYRSDETKKRNKAKDEKKELRAEQLVKVEEGEKIMVDFDVAVKALEEEYKPQIAEKEENIKKLKEKRAELL